MYDFTRETWTDDDTERYRQRIARMSDERLFREIEAGIFLTQPDTRPPREAFVIQFNLDRLEAMKRGARMAAPWEAARFSTRNTVDGSNVVTVLIRRGW